jgi:hypothetical protein
MSGEPDSVLSMRYHRAATTRETLAALLISERTLRDDPMRSTIFPLICHGLRRKPLPLLLL